MEDKRKQIERFNLFMGDKGLNQTKLSNKLKLTHSTISLILSGKNSLTYSVVLSLKAEFSLNPDWLLYGTEPMYLPGPKPEYNDQRQKEINEAYKFVLEPAKQKIHEAAIKLREDEKNRQKKQEEREEKEKSTLKKIETKFIDLPVMGIIPAGELNIVEVNSDETYPVPDYKMRKGFEYYLLRVVGNSMIDCNISENDIVIIEKRNNPENNKICAVRIENEHTLKRFHFDISKNIVNLIPCNKDLSIKSYPAQNVAVEGVVIGKINYEY